MVTGAAGLVGRALVGRLQRENTKVVPVIRNSSALADAVVLDLSKEGEKLPDLVKEPPEAVVHLAAVAPPRYPDTPENAQLTIQADRNVAAAVRSWGAKYLYVSTCGLYDPKTPEWKDESAKIETRTPYFSVKKMGEDGVLAMSGTIFRISSPFGAGMISTLVVPQFIDAVLRRERISIWGSGKREQDFISVSDIADAIVDALARNSSGIFNIASGKPLSMNELAHLIVETCGRGKVVRDDKIDPLDGQTARYEISRAAAILQWKPKTELRDYVMQRCRMELR
ncbi:NAD-dependent epimerase/dehydratase family protein [Bradyrhizobium sp.]|uniref:NAD-dependent epimerase/dehydratase family protein n=1 Tax=Bradyrhizobium sp. TaxID=376 RepID=UPI003C74E690